MIYLIVNVILLLTGSYLIQKHLGYDDTDQNLMIIGVLGFGGISELTYLLIGLFTGMSGAVLLSHAIAMLFSFGLAYYFHTKN